MIKFLEFDERLKPFNNISWRIDAILSDTYDLQDKELFDHFRRIGLGHKTWSGYILGTIVT
jgi:hypothetical protein